VTRCRQRFHQPPRAVDPTAARLERPTKLVALSAKAALRRRNRDGEISNYAIAIVSPESPSKRLLIDRETYAPRSWRSRLISRTRSGWIRKAVSPAEQPIENIVGAGIPLAFAADSGR